MKQEVIELLLIEEDLNEAQRIQHLLDAASMGEVGLVVAHIEHVTDLAEAIRYLKSNPGVALALLDLTVPWASEEETARAIRSLTERLPVMALGGAGDEQAGRVAVNAGAETFLLKERLDAYWLPRAIVHAMASARERAAQQADSGLNRTVLEALSTPLAVLDRTGQIVVTNEEWNNLIHSSYAPCLQGMGVGSNFLHWCQDGAPDDHSMQRLAAGIQAVLAGTQAAFTKVHGCHGATAEHWLKMHATPYGNGQDGAVLTIENVTSQRLAQKAIYSSEARYRSLFNTVPAGLYRTSAEGQVLDANRALLDLLGYPDLPTLQQRRVDELYVQPERRAELQGMLAQQNLVRNVELELRRLDESTIWVLDTMQAVQDEQQQVRYFEGSLLDITERKRAELALAESEERYRRLVELSPDGIAIHQNNVILFVNQAGARLIGAQRAEELVGRSLLDFVHPTSQPLVRERVKRMLAGETDLQPTEEVFVRLDGTTIDVEVASVPFLLQGTTAIQVVVRDISGRKQAAEALKQRNRELTVLNRIISEAASNPRPLAVLESTCRELGRAFEVPQVAAAVLDKNQRILRVIAEFVNEGYPSGLHQTIIVEGNAATEYVLEHKVPLAVTDAQQDPRLASAHELMRWRGTQSLLLVPLVLRNRVLGTIGIDSTERREWQEEEVKLAQHAAAAVAQVIESSRLFRRIQRQAAELAALTEVSLALRFAITHEEMVPLILGQVQKRLRAEGMALALREPATGKLVIKMARGQWPKALGAGAALTDAVSQRVLATSEPFKSTALSESDAGDLPYGLTPRLAATCIPLIANQLAIGVLWVLRRTPLGSRQFRLLGAIADITASALHRATLYEESERRVEHLAALRRIDMALTGSVDLQVTSTVLLTEVMSQLKVDAAQLLRLNPNLQTLEPITSQGFRTAALRHTHLRVGEGYAGRAALERQLIEIPNLRATLGDLGRSPRLPEEGFVGYYATPLISKGQVKGVLELFTRSPHTPSGEWYDFLDTLAGQAALAFDSAAMFNDLQQSNLELRLAYDATIEGWSRALDLRDHETEGHSQRVTEMTMHLGIAMGISNEQLVHMRWGALLHDIGKMGVPDHILRKPGVLTEEEWTVMRLHPVYAYNLLSSITFLREALDIPYCHHEKWNGKGYPRGLRGEQIPLVARIFAVVDVWDALISHRPYRAAWPTERALALIKEEAGHHFDPTVVKHFVAMLE